MSRAVKVIAGFLGAAVMATASAAGSGMRDITHFDQPVQDAIRATFLHPEYPCAAVFPDTQHMLVTSDGRTVIVTRSESASEGGCIPIDVIVNEGRELSEAERPPAVPQTVLLCAHGI